CARKDGRSNELPASEKPGAQRRRHCGTAPPTPEPPARIVDDDEERPTGERGERERCGRRCGAADTGSHEDGAAENDAQRRDEERGRDDTTEPRVLHAPQTRPGDGELVRGEARASPRGGSVAAGPATTVAAVAARPLLLRRAGRRVLRALD